MSSGFVTAVAQAAKFALNLVSAVVLARLVTPEEFGIVGMVLAATALLGLFKEAGLSTATVQRETITQDQVSNLFWINVGLSGVVTLLCCVLAPFIAWFYREPRLVDVMIVLSVTFLLTGTTVQHNALLIRQMRFRAIAVIEVFSMLAGIVVGCCMALLEYGYWALVAMQICVAASTLGLTWLTSGWRPSLPKRQSGVAPLVKFGAHLTLSDLVGRLAAGTDGILIGRFFGAESLGLYTRAQILLARPLEQLMSPISSVVIPVLSRLQSDPEKYRNTFLRAYDTMAVAVFPLTALFFVLSEPLVLILLGPEWKPAAPLFAGFTLVAVSLPLSVIASWLFMSQGRGQDLFHTYSATGTVTVVAFVAGLPWGPLGVVLALAIASLLIRLPIMYYRAGRYGPVSDKDLWKRFLTHLPLWAIVFVATSLARTAVIEAPPVLQLLLCLPVGALAAVGGILILKLPREIAAYLCRALWGLIGMHWARAMRYRSAPTS